MSKKIIWSMVVLILLFAAGSAIVRGLRNKTVIKTFVASSQLDHAPVSWRVGDQIVGAGPDLAKEIFKNLNVNIDSRYAGEQETTIAKAKNGEIALLITNQKTNNLEEYFDYSAAFAEDAVALFVKRGKGFAYRDRSSLLGKKGMAVTGDSFGQSFDDFIKEMLTVERIGSLEEAMNKIENEEADYLIYSLDAGEAFLKQKNWRDKIAAMPKTVASARFYFAFSKKSVLGVYLNQANDLIKKYQNDGTIEALINKHKNNNEKEVSFVN